MTQTKKQTKAIVPYRGSQKSIPRPPGGHKSNYVYYSFNNVGIGNSTGVYGTGSLGMNDYLMNNNTAINTGTSVNNRLSNNIYFTTLQARLFFNLSPLARVRVIVGKTNDPDLASAATNTAITGLIESTEVLLPNLRGTTLGVVEYFPNTESHVSILADVMLGGHTSVANNVGLKIVPFEVEIPLNLQRSYDNSGNVDRGSWFIYMVTTDPTLTTVFGSIKANWAQQVDS